ncbi:MAG: asparaginase [Acidimicrobiales bacterium]
MRTGRIHVVATGGTISSHFDGTKWAELSGGDLVAELGELRAQVSVQDAATGDSASLTPPRMLEIVRAVEDALGAGADGVVVTHGTDTMEQTAYLADLFLGPDLRAPVVFTGAMRPHSAPGSDGKANLAAAIALAGEPDIARHGVVAVLNGAIHRAVELAKVDATRLDAFVSIPGPRLGRVGDPVADLGEPLRRCWQTPTCLKGGVRLLAAYPELEPGLVAQFAAGSRGLVIEVFGALNLPGGLWEVVHRLAHEDLPVVLAGRPYATGFNDEGLDFLGVVGSAGRSAMKARLALMAALGSASKRQGQMALLESYLKGAADS